MIIDKYDKKNLSKPNTNEQSKYQILNTNEKTKYQILNEPKQTMVKPREPPAVEKPHISQIGMLPQVVIFVNFFFVNFF